MWVEYAGEIWPVPDALIAHLAGMGQVPGIPEGPPGGYMMPGGGGLLPPRMTVPDKPPTGYVMPVRPGVLPPSRRAPPRYKRKYVCEWRMVRAPESEPPRTVWAD